MVETKNKEINGFFLIDKETHWTSFDVVKYCKLKLKFKKVGHAGTLDPMATGLLVLLINKATKKFDYFLQFKKTYKVKIQLFASTETGDSEASVNQKTTPFEIKENEILSILKSMKGDIRLKVPDLSAKKINGKKLYELKRSNKKMPIIHQDVKIYFLKLINFSSPFIELEVQVSSGTYIRSIVQEISNKLNTIGFMKNLQRTSIGNLRIQDAVKIKNISMNDLIELKDPKENNEE